MATPSRDDLLDISFNLSGAVLNQDNWNQTLQGLANVFDGSFATFEVIDKKSGRHIQHIDSSDMVIQEKYIDYYVPLNPRIKFGFLPNSPLILHDHLLLTEQEMDRDEFYSDFLQPHDLRYFLSYKAYETADVVGVFTIQRNARCGPASDGELLALKQLSPSFSKVADLQIRYSHLYRSADDLESRLEASEDGIIFLNEFGYIRGLNSSAENILKKGDGFSFLNGNLICTDSKCEEKLKRLLFLVGNGNETTPKGKNVLITRPSGLPPYQVRIQNSAKYDMDKANNDTVFIMFIQDTSINRHIEIDEFMDSFGFTAAEANVAISIANGKTATEIAELSSVSIPTIRTHIQHLMQKMSVNRQVDIVRILSRYL